MCAAFKDPKFVEMFDEYAKAIADPEVGGCGRGGWVCVCWVGGGLCVCVCWVGARVALCAGGGCF